MTEEKEKIIPCLVCGDPIEPKRAEYLTKQKAELICKKCAEKLTTKIQHKPALPAAGREGEGVAQES